MAIDDVPVPLQIANATVVSNEQFVFPNGYITTEDKWGLLSAGGPEYTLLEGSDNDFSVLVSVGPYLLESGQTLSIAYAYCVGNTLDEMMEAVTAARDWYQPVPAEVAPGAVPTTSADWALSVSPNPSSGPVSIRLRGGLEVAASLGIYDAQGRQIRSLALAGAGDPTTVWDGHSETGSRVAPGIYFARLQSAGPPIQAAIVRLR